MSSLQGAVTSRVGHPWRMASKEADAGGRELTTYTAARPFLSAQPRLHERHQRGSGGTLKTDRICDIGSICGCEGRKDEAERKNCRPEGVRHGGTEARKSKRRCGPRW